VDTHLRFKEANDVLKNQAEILEQKYPWVQTALPENFRLRY
jgi:hypothetical protein